MREKLPQMRGSLNGWYRKDNRGSGKGRKWPVEGQTVEMLWMLSWVGVVFVAHFSVLAIWVSWH